MRRGRVRRRVDGCDAQHAFEASACDGEIAGRKAEESDGGSRAEAWCHDVAARLVRIRRSKIACRPARREEDATPYGKARARSAR